MSGKDLLMDVAQAAVAAVAVVVVAAAVAVAAAAAARTGLRQQHKDSELERGALLALPQGMPVVVVADIVEDDVALSWPYTLAAFY
mmetsp:Transcript_19220/g.26706  ORF Transcript_19220/g.26706 Transcript_19220/m.26706 type:complete len:86 (-) Transcript_19220:400-657(-)